MFGWRNAIAEVGWHLQMGNQTDLSFNILLFSFLFLHCQVPLYHLKFLLGIGSGTEKLKLIRNTTFSCHAVLEILC